MKFAKPFAIASVIAVAGTSAVAGGLNTAIETPPLIIPEDEPTGTAGSLRGSTPALIALLIIGGVVAAGGS